MSSVFSHLFLPQRSNNHRPSLLQVEGVGVLAALLIVSDVLVGFLSTSHPVLPAVLGFSSSITASQVVEQTNDQRRAQGETALQVNSQLNQAALAKGNNMCQDQYWAHISPSGTTPWVFIKNSGYKYAVAGENLARDFFDTPSMVAAWMASPTHRANIVNTHYHDIGVAVVDCKLLGSDTTLVVQMFGTLVAEAPAPALPKVAAIKTLTPVNPSPTPQAIAQAKVEGEESVPRLLANADPSLQLTRASEVGNRAFSRLQVIKAVMVSILVTLIAVLGVDLWLTHKRQTVRVAGKNLAHIVFLFGILMVVILVKAGVIF